MSESRPSLDLAPYTLDLAGLGDGPLDWPSIFGNDRPVELEVGSGKGLFLANAGTARPDRNFLGIELSNKYARLATERIAKRGLTNVRMHQGDAKAFLHQRVGAGSVAVVHIYFPDPWWKSRHKKRRVFNEGFVTDVERILQPGGDFRIATDVEEYYMVMQAILASHPRLNAQPPPEPNAPQHELDYLTNFERKYRIEGRPIYRAHYRLDG